MNRHIDDDRLQDYREGFLAPGEEAEVRAHLEGCSRCRGELEALGRLLDGMAELPQEAQPSRDLWPQIAWRIGGAEGAAGGTGHASRTADVDREGGRGGRRITLAAWQLLAASLVLALISGGAVWAFLSGTGAPGVPSVAQGPATLAQPAGWTEALQEYSDAVTEMEAVLERGRDVLDPETVRVLEESLASIDQAIRESRAVLERDPNSAVVRKMLTDNLRRKVDLLRHAAAAVYANT